MKKEKLNIYVGKKVGVLFFDDDLRFGTLGQGKGLGNGLYNDDPSWYHLKEERLSFRSSHVKKIKEVTL